MLVPVTLYIFSSFEMSALTFCLSMPKSVQSCSLSWSYSTNDPASNNRCTLSLAVSLPWNNKKHTYIYTHSCPTCFRDYMMRQFTTALARNVKYFNRAVQGQSVRHTIWNSCRKMILLTITPRRHKKVNRWTNHKPSCTYIPSGMLDIKYVLIVHFI